VARPEEPARRSNLPSAGCQNRGRVNLTWGSPKHGGGEPESGSVDVEPVPLPYGSLRKDKPWQARNAPPPAFRNFLHGRGRLDAIERRGSAASSAWPKPRDGKKRKKARPRTAQTMNFRNWSLPSRNTVTQCPANSAPPRVKCTLTALNAGWFGKRKTVVNPHRSTANLIRRHRTKKPPCPSGGPPSAVSGVCGPRPLPQFLASHPPLQARHSCPHLTPRFAARPRGDWGAARISSDLARNKC